MTDFRPITPQQQPKFAGIKTFMRLPHTRTIEGTDFVVAGVPWDGATSYRTGQRLGPDAIRKVSVTLRPYNLMLNVDIFEYCSGTDYGDLPVVAGYIEETYARIEAELCPLVEAGGQPRHDAGLSRRPGNRDAEAIGSDHGRRMGVEERVPLALDDVQVRPTHTTGANPDPDFARARHRVGQVDQPQGPFGHRGDPLQNHRFHQVASGGRTSWSLYQAMESTAGR